MECRLFVHISAALGQLVNAANGQTEQNLYLSYGCVIKLIKDEQSVRPVLMQYGL